MNWSNDSRTALYIFIRRLHCKKLKTSNDKYQQEVETLNKQIKEDKEEYQDEIKDIKQRFWLKECEITSKLEEKGDLIYRLNHNVKNYLAELGRYINAYLHTHLHTYAHIFI